MTLFRGTPPCTPHMEVRPPRKSLGYNKCVSYILCFHRNNEVRKRRELLRSIKFTAINIYVIPGYPKVLSSSKYELQYTVLSPTAHNQSSSKVLNINTAKNALEVYTESVSKKLRVTLLESSIVGVGQSQQSTGDKPGPKEPEPNIWVYVGSAAGALILIALVVYATVYFTRRR